MQGKIMKILGQGDPKDSDDGEGFLGSKTQSLWHFCPHNDSQKRMGAVLTIHPTFVYPFFSRI